MREQEKFDSMYITSYEIGKRMKVARSVVMRARQRGALPGAISIPGNGYKIWVRKEIEPRLTAWQESLKIRRTQ